MHMLCKRQASDAPCISYGGTKSKIVKRDADFLRNRNTNHTCHFFQVSLLEKMMDADDGDGDNNFSMFDFVTDFK